MTGRIVLSALLLASGFTLIADGNSPAEAALMVFNSDTPATNVATRANWLAAIGIAAPVNLLDFESGFIGGQNVHGNSFAEGLIVSDLEPLSSTGYPGLAVVIQQGPGSVGGSNPVGSFALGHDDRPFLVLDFTAHPVDYLGFRDIDHHGMSAEVHFIGGGQVTLDFDATFDEGDAPFFANTGEFIGLYCDNLPPIWFVLLDGDGDGEWAADNIEYGMRPSTPTRHPTWGRVKALFR